MLMVMQQHPHWQSMTQWSYSCLSLLQCLTVILCYAEKSFIDLSVLSLLIQKYTLFTPHYIIFPFTFRTFEDKVMATKLKAA